MFLLALPLGPSDQAKGQEIDTQGKPINTRGGALSTGGGLISTGGASITANGGAIIGKITLGLSSTVSGLGLCDAGQLGALRIVTDAAASPAYNATATGGGSITLPVFCDGTNWKNH